MAATTTFVPVDVYLNTSYRPDCDYVDGEVRERNVGELPHGRLQAFFIRYFGSREAEWNVEAIPEQRVQISASRFRVPDVCILRLSSTDDLIVRTPPVLCIEILSREDRMSEMAERVDDYLEMGVTAVRVIDPSRRKALAAGALRPMPEELTIPGTGILIPTAAMFAELDQRRDTAR